jgi:metaxin
MTSHRVTTTSTMKPLHAIFPLHTFPPVPLPATPQSFPTLWIHPPHNHNSLLSADVECLKWQAYLALRAFSSIHIRTDIAQQGALDRRLPNLHISPEKLLPAHHIPTWADAQLSETPSELEGYNNVAARDESRAWVSLLEGHVHAALQLSARRPSYFLSLVAPRSQPTTSLEAILTPPPAPLTGFTSLFPPSGVRVSHETISSQYRDAIAALSDRLGTDKWFLGSEYVFSYLTVPQSSRIRNSGPTPLDALAFAYLHSITNSQNSALRFEVSRRVNLVAWEWRVRALVHAAFVQHHT